MSKWLWLAGVLLLCVGLQATATGNAPVVQKMNLMPLSFTQNCGQWNEQALFRANAGGFTVWFAKDKIYYQFTRRIDRRGYPSGRPDLMQRMVGDSPSSPYDVTGRYERDNDSVVTMSISATFVGAKPNPQVVGEGLMEYKCNYFIGNDPTKWHTDVPNFKAVVYKDIYPGIDLKYYGNGDGKIEYDFIVKPGADPSQIAIRYDGANEVCVDDVGQLVVETEWGRVIERAPLVYQMIDGERKPLVGNYHLRSENVFGFQFGEDYSPQFALVIDPVLTYSSYLGGSSNADGCGDIVVDSAGSAYVTGSTSSFDFPTVVPFDGSLTGEGDAFVTKLSPAGSSLIYSTYLGGGSDTEGGSGIAVDSAGSAYVTGSTYSSNFPTVNPFDGSYNGVGDAFVTKLSPAGNSLIYSTYLGGTRTDRCSGIALDSAGSAYVTGQTYSSNFPTVNPFDGTYTGNTDAFVTKLSPEGNSLLYSTYLGGDIDDEGDDIAVDSAGSAYVTGYTTSPNFPTANPFDGSLGGTTGSADAFVTKLSPAGNSLVYSSYLGGSLYEVGFDIALDGAGSAYVTGVTDSYDFPTVAPFDGTWSGATDAFVTKVSPGGNSLAYSTYLGGSSDDFDSAIAVDSAGSAYVTGSTRSSNFPTACPLDGSLNGTSDAFVTKVSPAGDSLFYSSYLGGSGYEDGAGIAADSTGSAYVTGATSSSDFPTIAPFDGSLNGIYDAFVTKVIIPLVPSCGDANGDNAVDISDAVYLIAYIFSGGPTPCPLFAADANCDLAVDISDAVYLIGYIFAGGPAPCAGC